MTSRVPGALKVRAWCRRAASIGWRRWSVTDRGCPRTSTIPVDTEVVGDVDTRLRVQDHLVNDEFDPVFAEIDQILDLINRSQLRGRSYR